MHELSLAAGILRLVEDAAVRERFRRVALLRLEAGGLAGVEVAALRFALDAIAPGTCLEGAQITIDEPPGRACLVNRVLGQRLRANLDSAGLTVLEPQAAGCGDAGLALGQAWIAGCTPLVGLAVSVEPQLALET